MGTFHQRLGPLLLALAIALALAPAAGAGNLYLSGSLGIAANAGDSGGFSTILPSSPSGSDWDATPIYRGAFGWEFSMHEAYPYDMQPFGWGRRLPDWARSRDTERWEMRLPSWEVRLELEGSGGRDAELKTDGLTPTTPFRTDVTSYAAMGNLWIDTPLRAPIALLFGRIPVLEPLSIYTGFGLGLGIADVTTSDSVSMGSKTVYNFAYQLGAGFGYAFSDRLELALGYRYMNLGDVDLSLSDGVQDQGNFTMDLASHEVTSSLRFNFYSVRFPVRWD